MDAAGNQLPPAAGLRSAVAEKLRCREPMRQAMRRHSDNASAAAVRTGR
jgi:hypothetical protein